MRVDSVITLNNDLNCLLLDKVTYDANNYFMAVILNEEEEPSDEYVIFKEIIENDSKYVEKVEDENTLMELLKLFTKSFGDMVNNLPEEL